MKRRSRLLSKLAYIATRILKLFDKLSIKSIFYDKMKNTLKNGTEAGKSLSDISIENAINLVTQPQLKTMRNSKGTPEATNKQQVGSLETKVARSINAHKNIDSFFETSLKEHSNQFH